MITSAMLLASKGRLEPIWERRGGQPYYEQGSPLWSHASSAAPDEAQSS
jgi:hypothetical protein